MFKFNEVTKIRLKKIIYIKQFIEIWDFESEIKLQPKFFFKKVSAKQLGVGCTNTYECDATKGLVCLSGTCQCQTSSGGNNW